MVPSSFGISVVEDFTMILQQDQLETLQKFAESMNAIPDFHIYMIVRRPRISFVPETLTINQKFIGGFFKIQEKDTYKLIEFKYEHHFKELDLKFECIYPYNKLFVLNNREERIFGGIASLILQELNSKDGLYHDLSEVIYIGQSFGKGGERTAQMRLQEHKTLQQIYADNTPDKEIWITLWSFTRNELMFLSPSEDDSKNHNLFRKFSNYIGYRYENISFEQEINFTEAALIRYFQPRYNDDFKYTFPSRSHTTYSQCYKLGLDYVAVEIDTKRLNMQLWSETKSTPKFKHNIFYELNNNEAIKDFFRLNNLFQ
ncbi:hypothetical protein J27TS8_05100 [Robertmurraya siralis]|uniref:Uncharacterized protein n=1 Tax=Robertmurraya siralis TaxID=77777 RepID=A0A920BSS3_9BACI|nr:hypothetical protein [Robertmurraya siralis]PAE21977.1 hypothetical protein CHH80_03525 [Bacillus sp. 7504-2]GIN60517.1 hypothetical protein J27TS8_05100 [Robertmurraya siralis]